jgi:hypothetical protein
MSDYSYWTRVCKEANGLSRYQKETALNASYGVTVGSANLHSTVIITSLQFSDNFVLFECRCDWGHVFFVVSIEKGSAEERVAAFRLV